MTTPPRIDYAALDPDALAEVEGRVAVVMGPGGALDPVGRRVSAMTQGALGRFAEGPEAGKMKPGDVRELAYPAGIRARGVLVLRLDGDSDAKVVRSGGAALARAMGSEDLVVAAGSLRRPADLALGLSLGAYDYRDQRGPDPEDEDAGRRGTVTLMVAQPDAAAEGAGRAQALAEGIYLVRDLVNAPANVLTTTAFAERLEAMRADGLEVEVLDEPELEELGMRTLLAVGRGSESPTKVVVMRWQGGGDEPPLALVGKGVVFDTGGISIKPGAGMEDMTMDMGGAATVAGVMHALARRGARANVVGLVGLVENMPDGRAQRPGDVVRSMKGDTVEVINTDAEGRLVLADVIWYAQERFEPAAVIDLATLTGAIIVALGHENAGVFSNDEALAKAFLDAARAEGEGAWLMPLGKAYDRALKSRIADMKNVGGREAGAVTAAQFIGRFVKEGTPWIHLDIAGTASVKKATDLAPAGATGWGVLALDRLVRERFEARAGAG